MEIMTRRAFMRWLTIQFGAIAGGRFLTACGLNEPQSKSAAPLGKSTNTLPPGATATHPESIATLSPTIISSYPELAVARGGEPEALVRAALMALGGMEQFVNSGDDVIIKPNVCVDYRSYEYAATTNPWVVGALVKLCWEAGAARVRVLDYPFGGSSERAYVKSGIQEQVFAAGGEMENIANFKFVKTEIPEAIDLRNCYVYDDVLLADVVINVPIAKHHSLALLTLGMKNLMGVIRDRPAMHGNLG